MRKGLACILWVLSSGWSFAQITFTARTDQAEITQDQYLELAFVLENAQGSQFSPPRLDDWTVISGPSTSSQMTIVNGTRSSSFSYIYSLAPKRLGTLTIGSASIQVSGKTFSTDPVTIRVVKAAPSNNQGINRTPGKGDLFIQVTAKPEKAFVGQQIQVEYKLFTTLDVDNYNISYTPDFKGFHLSHVPRFNFPTNRETLNGRTYMTKVIQAFAVYPIQSGDYAIDPMHVRVSIVVDEDNAQSFFLLPTTKGINLMSNPLDIRVEALPAPVPAHFSGAVGRFKMASRIDQLAIKTNEAAMITIYLEGDGDLNRVGKPFLQTDSSVFQVYEPKVTREDTDYKVGGFISQREFSYPLVALAPGNYKIIPSFTYFDVDSNAYLTLSPEVFNMLVTGQAVTSAPEPAGPAGPGGEILPLIANPAMHRGNQFVGSAGFFLLLLLPGLILLGQDILLRGRRRRERLGKSERLKLQARQQALQKLDSLLSSEGPKRMEEVNALLTGYLRTKWGLGEQPYTLQEWHGIVDAQVIPPESKKEIHGLLHAFELAIYAGQPTADQFNEWVMKAKRVVEGI
ncbi:MAG TPA: BatD family protein [Saprospiraceae bacterium]|nr:BatD family protein [Saprospiraceae bacterium]HNT21667.1 BatD family protein [Saprospiraceae bacterium]